MNVDLIDAIRQSKLSSSNVSVSSKGEEKIKQFHQAFFHENITLTLEKGHEPASWSIPRFRLTPGFIDEIVNRTLNGGATFLYLKEINGEGLIITRNNKRFNLVLKAPPVQYRIELDEPVKTKDVLATSYYDGEMKIILRGIPRRSQSYLHTVQQKDVERWLIDSILSEDPVILSIQKEVEDIDKSRKSVLNLLNRLPDEVYYNSKGVELKGAQAKSKREGRYKELSSEKQRLVEEYTNRISEMQSIIQEHEKGIEFHIDIDEEGKDWILSFHGKSKSSNEGIVLAKKNWKTCFLYAFGDADLDKRHPSCNDYLVDITNVSVERVEHGNGLFYKRQLKKTAEKFSCLGDSQVFHFGSFHGGQRHGEGIELTISSLMVGHWQANTFKQGTIFFKDGDMATNSFSSPNSITDSLNPYAKESQNGLGIIRFTDGAIYEGTMKDGEVTGDGIYISAIGERIEGKFLQGALVKGVIRRSNGDQYGGNFDHFSLIHGHGFFNSKTKRSNYSGYFDNGEMQYGEEIYLNKRNLYQSKYKGYYSIGDRCGLGMFQFRDNWQSYDTHKVDLCVHSFWISGSSMSGGSITNLQNRNRFPTTNHSSSGYKWLNRFHRVEKFKLNNSIKKDDAVRKDDLLKRCRISDKKTSIFHQTRTIIELILHDLPYNEFDDDLSLISRSTFIAPSSIDEAETKRGLHKTEAISRIQLRLHDTIHTSEKMKKILEVLEKLEHGWGVCN